MLSDRSRPVVEATLPVVADNIPEIASRFYAHMFGDHPELLDGVFNRGNQAEGTQQLALAGSVAAFASALVQTRSSSPSTCWPGSRTSTPRSASRPDAVRDRPRLPVLGDRRRARRRRDARGRGGLGRGLLADGLRADRPGARPLQRARRRPETVWRDWEVEREDPGDRRRRDLPLRRTDDRLVRTSLPGQYVTVQCRCPTASASRGSTA